MLWLSDVSRPERDDVESREPEPERTFRAIWDRDRACSAIPGDRNRTSPWSGRARIPVPASARALAMVQSGSWRSPVGGKDQLQPALDDASGRASFQRRTAQQPDRPNRGDYGEGVGDQQKYHRRLQKIDHLIT